MTHKSTHKHWVDCMDFYPSGLGGWIGICEITKEKIYIKVTGTCTINRPHLASDCNGDHISIEDA